MMQNSAAVRRLEVCGNVLVTLLLALCCLPAGGVDTKHGVPPGEWRSNVMVSDNSEVGFEPAIAVDGHGNIFVPYMDLASRPHYTLIAVSNDDGVTFHHAFKHVTPDGKSGDVTAAVDPMGNAYVAFVSYHYSGDTLVASDLLFTVSNDHGATWSTARVVSPGIVAGKPLFTFDRPWLTTRNDGAVELTVARWPALSPDETMDLVFFRSTDHGRTWSHPITYSSPPDSQLLACFGVFDLAGEVIVPYADFPSNEGAADEVGVLRLGRNQRKFSRQSIQTLQFQGVEYNKAFPGFAGTVASSFFSFVGSVAGELRVNVMHSKDGGRSFDAFKSVDTGLKETQAQPAIASDDSGHAVVVWLDDRSGKEELWGRVIEPDGGFLQAHKISDAPLNYGTTQAEHGGDYLNVAIAHDTAYTVWGDRRTGRQGIYFSATRVR